MNASVEIIAPQLVGYNNI